MHQKNIEFKSGRWINLSYDLSEKTPVPPGIPALSRTIRSSMNRGDISNVVDLFLCNHSGTHMDAPLHFDAGGLALTELDVNDFFFTKPLVIDIPLSNGQLVGPEHLRPFGEALAEPDLLLIRTGFSRYRFSDPERYRLDGPGFSAAGARYVVENLPRLRCLGLDTISLASMRELEEGLRAHQILLGGGRKFLIIEDMDLDFDLSGLSEVIALPLLVEGLDGGPCTVIGRSGCR